MLDGLGGLPLLDELLGDLEAEGQVVGAELRDLGQLGAGLVAAVGGLVVVGQRLVDLHGVGRLLELLVGLVDELLEPAGARQHADGGHARGIGVVGIVDVGIGLAGRRGRAEDLHGDLDGDVELVLPLVLEHQADQRRGLVAGASAGAAQHGLGQLVQAELVHLAGEPDLGIGVEPQAEEPLGRLPGPLEVAAQDGHPQRQLLAALHGGVVERLYRLGHLQRVVAITLLLQELGQLEPQARFGPRGLGDPSELGDRLVLVAVPQQDVAGAEPRIGRVGRVGRRLRLLEEMPGQVAHEVVALVELVGRAQDLDRRLVDVIVGQREVDRDVPGALADVDLVLRGVAGPVGSVQRPVGAGRGAGALVLEPAAERRHLVIEDLQDVVERLAPGTDAHPLGQRAAGAGEVIGAGVIVGGGAARLEPLVAVEELAEAVDVSAAGGQCESPGDLCELLGIGDGVAIELLLVPGAFRPHQLVGDVLEDLRLGQLGPAGAEGLVAGQYVVELVLLHRRRPVEAVTPRSNCSCASPGRAAGRPRHTDRPTAPGDR